MPWSRRRSSGFTLTELLVVIGVMAVLMAFLFPALSRARRASNQTMCASNLRQWGMAVHLYANENAGYLPRRGQGVAVTVQVDRPTDWFNALPPMLQMPAYIDLVNTHKIPRSGASSVWMCPESNDREGPYYWSYAMNMGLSVWEADQNEGLPDKISNVGDSCSMVFLTDGPGDHCSVFPSKYPNNYNPVPRHGKMVNICFLDGHVAAFTGSYIGCAKGMIDRADVQWHPPGSTWNSAR